MQTDSPIAVDYHCHLDLYPDFEKKFAQCTDARIATLAVTTTPRAWPRNKQLSERFPCVRAALGLHPQLVGERAAELELFERYLTQARFIGEIGLDAGPQYYATFSEQKRVFRRILQLCAAAGNKILSIHSVRATREVLNCIQEFLAQSKTQVVLHWFGGSQTDAKRAVDLGCYFSVNNQMFASPSSRRVIELIPPDRILTETDGPFVQVNGRPIEPGEVAGAIRNLSLQLQCNVPQTQDLLLNNLAKLESSE